MKIKVIRDYNSIVLDRLVKKNEVLEVEDARGRTLIDAKVAEAIVETEKSKTRSRKKVDEYEKNRTACSSR